jgi:uncharacterized protein
MKISYDPAKRAKTLVELGLAFADALQVFASPSFTVADDRFDYGEARMITYGWLDGRPTAVIWVERFGRRRIISMRHMHEEERMDVGLDRP